MSDPLKEASVTSSKDPSPEVLFWQKEIDLAKKREKDFRLDAARVLKLYESQKAEASSYKILYAH